MLNKIRSKQVILIVAIVLLVGFLFSRDVKGLVKPKEEVPTMPATQQAAINTPKLTIEELSATAKNLVSNASVKEISLLENSFKSASGTEKLADANKLAQKWDDLEQPAPSAMYLEEVAKSDPNLNNWLNTGTRFLKAFDNMQEDEKAKPVMLQKANVAFTSALAIDTASNDAKAGLGITIVNGMGAPMQGIAMLMDVVKKDPKNLKANMNLGMFAIKSGQFDKAIIRFTDIIKNIGATPDAYFYLAAAYTELGKKDEAIDAYLSSKKLTANPTFIKYIDDRIAELKNKR